MIERLLLNLSLLVAMCVFSRFVMDHWPSGKKGEFWVQGVLFGLVAVAGMLIPVNTETGFIFDGRTVVLSLVAWYFGWRAAVVSTGMASGMRLMLGGPGAVPGTLVILMASAMGLWFRRWVDPVRKKATALQTLSLAMATHVTMFSMLVLLFPAEAKLFFVENMLIPLFVFYPLATLLVGRILMDQQENLRTMASLRESESRFRNLFEGSQVVMLMMEPETGRIRDANGAASRYYGWSAGELRGMKISDIRAATTELLPMDGQIDVDARVGNVLHLKHRLKNGQIREVDVYSSRVQGKERTLLCLMIFDVFQREEAEHNLRVALEEKALVLQTALSGYQMLDAEGRILEVNDAICEMSGYSRGELVGRTITDFSPDENEESLKETIDWIRTRGWARLEKRGFHKDGRVILYDISTRAIEIEGEVRICSFYQDITEIREREKLMRLHSAALEAAANQVMITDPQGNIVWVNRAFSEGTGYSMEDAIGKNPSELLNSGMQDTGYYRELWGAIQKGETWRGEISNRNHDGEHYQAEMTITPLVDSEGGITHYISITQDITEKKQMELLFHRAQRMEGIGSLSSGIAHDLNNILSPIMMSADILNSSLPEGPDKEMAELILRSTSRGAGIIQQLLAYARGAKGDKVEVNLVHLVKEVFHLYRGTFPPNIELVQEVDPEVWTISADPGQIHQVLSNLLVNARDALPESGGEIRLEANNRELDSGWARLHPPAVPGKFVQLVVEDNGSGMSEETLRKIFDPFFTTKSEGKGTGIGLPTALSLVKGHGGFLLITSTLGKGSRFEVYIPASHPGEGGDASAEQPAFAAAGHGKGERILVVDDEEPIRTMLKAGLQQLGYRVECVENGEKALARLDEAPEPDLILLDFMMPGIGGEGVLTELDKRGVDIPTLIISGMLPDSVVTDGKVMGRFIFYKPFSLTQLAERIRDLLGEARESRR